MTEIFTKVERYCVDKLCPNCYIGDMRFTSHILGDVFGENLNIYQHACSECSHTENYAIIYPTFRDIKVEKMGTRHLIEVKYDGETKIAQYGQWDGYPSGQGVEILKFLTNARIHKWLKALKKCRFFKSDEEIYEMFPLIEKSEDNIPPQLHRDTGAKILDLVYKSKDKIYLVDSRGSCGVQYWYKIDMDENTFTVSDRGPLCVTFKLNKLPKEKEFLETCESV